MGPAAQQRDITAIDTTRNNNAAAMSFSLDKSALDSFSNFNPTQDAQDGSFLLIWDIGLYKAVHINLLDNNYFNQFKLNV